MFITIGTLTSFVFGGSYMEQWLTSSCMSRCVYATMDNKHTTLTWSTKLESRLVCLIFFFCMQVFSERTTERWNPQSQGRTCRQEAGVKVLPPPALAAGTAFPTSRTGNAGWRARSEHTGVEKGRAFTHSNVRCHHIHSKLRLLLCLIFIIAMTTESCITHMIKMQWIYDS